MNISMIFDLFSKQEKYSISERETYNRMLKNKSQKIGLNISEMYKNRNKNELTNEENDGIMEEKGKELKE